MRRSLITATLFFSVIGRAQAQDATTGQSIDVHATFNNVGVDVHVAGDDNGDATASLQIDFDGTGFVAAHRLSRAAANRFVGSAFRLPDGTSFEVRVILDELDGVTDGTWTAQGTTRALVVPISTGHQWHVDTKGSDSADGSEAAPFATVARGLQAASAGDSVLVHAGVYHEEVTLNSLWWLLTRSAAE